MDRFPNLITLRKPNEEIVGENIPANVQARQAFILSSDIIVNEEDLISLKLGNGGIEEYRILYCKFYDNGPMPTHYQAEIEKINSIKKNSDIMFNISGSNNTVVANSQNTFINSDKNYDLFIELEKCLNILEDQSVKIESLQILKEMEQYKNSPTFLPYYTKFIEILANHISIISPFIPALTKCLEYAG